MSFSKKSNSRYSYPQFKAGLHGGKVTVTWVGEVKREVIFIEVIWKEF